MQIRRVLTHLFTFESALHARFPDTSIDRIEAAVRAAESGHDGQICVALEAALPVSAVLAGMTPRERALAVFRELNVWDTERNNGVLLYVLLADRDVEIVADRGIHRAAGHEAWSAICQMMEARFRSGDFPQAIVDGIAEVSGHLVRHFPGERPMRNELPDRPRFL